MMRDLLIYLAQQWNCSAGKVAHSVADFNQLISSSWATFMGNKRNYYKQTWTYMECTRGYLKLSYSLDLFIIESGYVLA